MPSPVNITLENLEPQVIRLQLELAPEDYKPAVDKALKNYAHKAVLPGFRQGKAPMGMIRRIAGISTVIQESTHIVQHKLEDYLKDSEIDVLGQIVPVSELEEADFDVNCEKTLAFQFDIAVMPKLELNLKLEKPVTRYKIVADDAAIDAEIEKIQRDHAVSEYPESVEAGDWVIGIVTTDELSASEGEPQGEGEASEKPRDIYISLNPERHGEAALAPLIGLGVGDSAPYDLKIFGDDAEKISETIYANAEDIATLIQAPETRLVIKRIVRSVPHELNEELFKKVFGEDTDILTEETLRARMRERAEAQLSALSKGRFRDALFKELLAANPFELPEDFLKQQLAEGEEDVTEGDVDGLFEAQREGYNFRVLINNLNRLYPETLPSSEQVEQGLKDFYAGAFNGEVDDEKFREFVRYINNDEKLRGSIMNRIYEETMFGVLEREVPSETVEISREEYETLED